MTHEPTEAPLCDECQAKDLCFFDPTCSGCQDLLLDSNTTISQLFAVMRQWVPQTQRNMSSLSREVLRRGANVNDRDGLTDLSLLHFACKSGAAGVGNIDAAVNLVNSLLNKGADSELRCKWTNMNALHYAVFFDVPEIVDTLLEHKPSLLHTTCDEFDGGTALHIAASNVSIRATQILLQHGANCKVTDRNGHTPSTSSLATELRSRRATWPSDDSSAPVGCGGDGGEEREAQVAADAEVEEGEREEGGEEDKENAMEIEPAVMV
ncbi:CAP-Gly domain-containing linker protein 3, partial [Geodia barretti]